jgi:uncharacterized YccA/Bax inhibitor family protein
MAENPVIRKFGEASRAVPTPSASELQGMYDLPAYSGLRASDRRYMTLDAVVQRTGAMLLTILAVGAVSWQFADTKAALPVLLIALVGSLGLGLYMSFTMKVNAATALLYAAFEGALLGAISRFFEEYKSGIVVQAILGTVMVAVGMLFVYRIGAIRVTPKFTRIVVGATIGAFGLMLVNIIASIFTDGGLGLRSGGAIAILFSLICIVIAAANLVLDFDMVEQGIRNGADEKFAWFAAFGITVTLVWLYTEILRLLSYLNDN